MIEVEDFEEIHKRIFDFDLTQMAEIAEEVKEEVFDAKKNRQKNKNK